MKTLKRLAVIALVAAVTVLWSLTALAQATNAAPAGGGSTPAPLDISGLSALWTALIAVVVPLVVAFLKKVIPKIPSALLPIGATALGVLSDFLLAKAGVLPHTSLALGALAGAAGVGVREIVDQAKQMVKGPTPPPTPPPSTSVANGT